MIENPLWQALDSAKKGNYGPLAIQALMTGGQSAYLSTITTETMRKFIEFQHQEAYQDYSTSFAFHLIQDERWKLVAFLFWYYRGNLEHITRDIRAYEKPYGVKIKPSNG